MRLILEFDGNHFQFIIEYINDIVRTSRWWEKMSSIGKYRVHVILRNTLKTKLRLPQVYMGRMILQRNARKSFLVGGFGRQPLYDEMGAAARNIHCYTVIGFW